MSVVFCCTSDPEFQTAAQHELRQRKLLTGKPEIIAPGVWLATSPVAEAEFSATLNASRPIYLRHVFPVHTSFTPTGTNADLDTLQALTLKLPSLYNIKPGMLFAVQVRLVGDDPETSLKLAYSPFAVKERLAPLIAEQCAAHENSAQAEVVLSVVITRNKALLGISAVADNLSDWAGGMRRFARPPEQISRAEFKLEEAREIFNLQFPPGGTALDLGSAPGGWARLLLEAGMRVTAVDPAALDPRVATSSNLTHYRGVADKFLEQNATRTKFYDAIVNDMRMDAIHSAQFMLKFAPMLKTTGFAVATLKLPHATPRFNPYAHAENALEVLRQGFRQVTARQLFHNRQEITVMMYP